MTTKRLPAEKRRKQILRSAIKVFARATYHGATTKSISEEAGVTEALIYRYFGSKRVLFTEAIDFTTARTVRGLERVLEEHLDDPMKALEACFAYYVDLLDKNNDSARILFLVLSELDQEDIREVYLPHQERALKVIAHAIRHWKSKGFVSESIDTGSAAWLYFGTYIVLALVKYSYGSLEIDVDYALGLAKPYVNMGVFDD